MKRMKGFSLQEKTCFSPLLRGRNLKCVILPVFGLVPCVFGVQWASFLFACIRVQTCAHAWVFMCK